ncbi:GNAT family N-acetyltransferase [Marinobacter sp. JSM 1782161]|uniref:GNAT family N-acetyltransferase n=1 Tax=Marinobacter sp. JSM 1782161 TaxID=2685906 RepID=UPI001403C62A|nr:GNAT family N-acetyltransferase [Marinobacter sp. JSM 1782161]
MRIESATLNDCHAIAAVHVETWQVAYQAFLPAAYLASLSVEKRAGQWQDFLTRFPGQLLVARRDARILGFIAYGPCRDQGAPGDRAEIWSIYVHPGAWSSGAGRRLWLAALKRLRGSGYRSVSLWVIAGNERAIRFYSRAGFVAEPATRGTFEIDGTTLEDIRYVYRINGDLTLER